MPKSNLNKNKEKLLQFVNLTPHQWRELVLAIDELGIDFNDADYDELDLSNWL